MIRDLKEIVEELLGGCERLSWLAKLMLSFAGVYYVFNDDCPANSLYYNHAMMDDFLRTRTVQLTDLVDFCASPTADMYDRIGRPLQAVLTSSPLQLRTRCSCVGADDGRCGTSLYTAADPFLCDANHTLSGKYAMVMKNVRSAYYIKCGVDL
jgi:hypothetical protein